ncbi:hypothetical protein Lser_V15G03039 [Lactuca serriola]
MTENYRAGLVTCAKEDRISNLPEHLIDSILERVPLEEAVRTSILSKNWRYRWTTMRALVFDQHFSKKFAKNGAFGRNGFIRVINQVLFLHKGPFLKFHLHIPDISLDSFQDIDQWMSFLSRNGVMELILTNFNRRYELPSYLFSCLELTKLKLQNCFFKPPPKFEGFLNLEDLYLRNVDFGASLCGPQISLPQLKKLSMYSCTNVSNFNIKATRIWSLAVFTCPGVMLLQLLHSPCISRFAIRDFVQGERMNLEWVLRNLPVIEALYIDGSSLKFLSAENIPKWLPHPVNSLKHLRLRNFEVGDLDQLHGALCLLRNSPNLKSSVIQLYMEPQVDVGLASNHLDTPNCLDYTLKQLQTVEIISLEGSGPELLFIKLLLAHSPSLESLTNRPSRDSDVQKRFDIAKDVMQFPRASTNAKMFYLDLEP